MIGPLRNVATLYTTENSSGKMKKCPFVVRSFLKKPIDICISKESVSKMIRVTLGVFFLYCCCFERLTFLIVFLSKHHSVKTELEIGKNFKMTGLVGPISAAVRL